MKAVMSDTLKDILNDKETRKELQKLLNQYYKLGFATGQIGGKTYTINVR